MDGIREVVLTAKGGGPELRVPVRENCFYLDLDDPRVDRVHWRYAGQDQSFSIESSFPDDTTPPPPDPKAGFAPVPGSDSDPVRFTAGGGELLRRGLPGRQRHRLHARSRGADRQALARLPGHTAPWEGEPIRFLMVFDSAPGQAEPGTIERPKLRVRLADGRSYLIES